MKHCSRPEEAPCIYDLLFWPLFGLRYLLIEGYCPAEGYHEISCALDDRIPFLEGFVIPYLAWHFCVIGMHLWLWFHDGKVFRQYSRYLMISMSISTVIFLLWPSCQNLRPASFPRDNVLTKVVEVLYRADTNTNVCPSEHMIGSVGFLLAVLHCKQLRRPGRRIPLGILAVLTAVATVFLKQHSVLDLVAALPVCLAGYFLSFAPGMMTGRTAEKKLRPNRDWA